MSLNSRVLFSHMQSLKSGQAVPDICSYNCKQLYMHAVNYLSACLPGVDHYVAQLLRV